MTTSAPKSFPTGRAAFKGGAADTIGGPAIVLFACYVGFGSLVSESGLALEFGLFSTLTAWALPGQVIMVEMYSLGASIVAITIAVLLTNARLLPMVMTLMPLIRTQDRPRWQLYAVAHLIAVTGWIAAMRRCPSLPAEQRMPYFVGFCMVIWFMSMAGTAVGFFLAGAVPIAVSIGLVFLNPLYFLLMLVDNPADRPRLLAVGLGLVLGPLFHALTPDWGLLLAGVTAGTLAFLGKRFIGQPNE